MSVFIFVIIIVIIIIIIIVIIVTVQCFVKKSSLTENCDLRVPISIDTILAHCKSLFRILSKTYRKIVAKFGVISLE